MPRPGEDGQAIVLVLIFVALIALLAPIVVTQVINEDAQVGVNQNFEAALAAAEAGVQQYRNNLDLYSNYWEYSSTNLPPAAIPKDQALEANGWQSVANASPPEAFHYIPALPTTNGTSAQVLLTVTGRAGTGPGSNNYVYRTIQVQLQSTGVFTNAYFSQYEVEDPAQNTNEVCVTAAGVSTQSCTSNTYCVAQTGNPKATAPCLGAEDYAAGSSSIPPLQSGKTYWQSLCQYDTWEANSFVDQYSANQQAIDDPYDNNVPFNDPSANPPPATPVPYYGPYQGNDPRTNIPPNGTSNNTFETFVNSSRQSYVANAQLGDTDGPCNGVYVFDSTESFTGPVYSNDQLWVCGSPNFGSGLQSGIGAGFAYDANWATQDTTVQGGKKVQVSGTQGWIDDGAIYSTKAENWDNNGCGGQSSPNFNSKLSQGGKESLPTLNSAILGSAEKTGCVYIGPTMIEFVSGGTFNVWSPLTPGSAGLGGACGTFSETTPFQTGLTIPSTGLVVYVDNLGGAGGTSPPLSNYIDGTTTNPPGQDPAGALPVGATCLDPWKPYAPSGCAEGTEGDAIIEGEVSGQVTVGAAANIVISRDLSYQCAGGPSGQDSVNYAGLPSLCSTPGHEDVLGLAANGDTVISKPGLQCASTEMPPAPPGILTGPNATTTCNDDDTPSQTEPYEWPAVTTSSNPQGFCRQDGAETPQTIADVVPDCEIQNPVMDAAIASLLGSFADEDWDMGSPSAGSAWLEGTDVGEYRGPMGCGGCGQGQTGYAKEFNYDQRLTYLTPPDMLTIAALEWTPTTLVNCGDIDDSGAGPSADGNGGAAICPGITGIN